MTYVQWYTNKIEAFVVVQVFGFVYQYSILLSKRCIINQPSTEFLLLEISSKIKLMYTNYMYNTQLNRDLWWSLYHKLQDHFLHSVQEMTAAKDRCTN